MIGKKEKRAGYSGMTETVHACGIGPRGGFRRFAALFFAALFLLLPFAAAGSEGESREERMARAREKYNEKTVNIYMNGRGKRRKGMFNVCFYYAGKTRELCISIPESLEINDEAEMEAVLELVMQNDNYIDGIFGTMAFMKAQWIAHNIAYSMAKGSSPQQKMVEAIVGESLSSIIASSKALDLNPRAGMTFRQVFLYEMVAAVYGLNETTE